MWLYRYNGYLLLRTTWSGEDRTLTNNSLLIYYMNCRKPHSLLSPKIQFDEVFHWSLSLTWDSQQKIFMNSQNKHLYMNCYDNFRCLTVNLTCICQLHIVNRIIYSLQEHGEKQRNLLPLIIEFSMFLSEFINQPK